jgi:transcriptional regulator with XRE-family HTH domain
MYGDLVRTARLERGLTQQQLAALAGIDQPNLSAIESGRRLPSAATLHRLLHGCGYRLTATAGHRVHALPPPVDDEVFHELLAPSDLDEAPVVTVRTPMRTRVAVINAVLDAADQTVRSRSWTSST